MSAASASPAPDSPPPSHHQSTTEEACNIAFALESAKVDRGILLSGLLDKCPNKPEALGYFRTWIKEEFDRFCEIEGLRGDNKESVFNKKWDVFYRESVKVEMI